MLDPTTAPTNELATARRLTSAVAVERLRVEGANTIEEHGRRSLVAILGGQLASPLVLLLIAASVVAIAAGDRVDAVIILIIVVLSAALGFVQEARSEGAVAALRARLALRATVIRDGTERDIPARELVRADMVVLNAGDIVPADGRLLEANHLYVDESALTGESAPALKAARGGDVDPTKESDRDAFVFFGTSVVSGVAQVELTATGARTTYGLIARRLIERAPRNADVGISVDNGTDVARAAADIVLLQPSLAAIAQGVREGRRTFANTLKYIRMGISSNFGNMLSMAGAAVLLPFLPMLPSQILLNNLIYDASQTAIPTDDIDPETEAEPARWDIGGIERFMLVFGPISSIFDYATFGFLLLVLHASEAEFHTGWFVESLATQVLVIFAIRTRRSPFWRSRPSRPLLAAALTAVALAVLLPVSPLAPLLGFSALPPAFWAALASFVVAYLAIVEIVKRWIYRREARQPDAGRAAKP